MTTDETTSFEPLDQEESDTDYDSGDSDFQRFLVEKGQREELKEKYDRVLQELNPDMIKAISNSINPFKSAAETYSFPQNPLFSLSEKDRHRLLRKEHEGAFAKAKIGERPPKTAFMLEREAVYKEGLDRIERTCDRYRRTYPVLDVPFRKMILKKSMVVDLEHGLAYCRHGKVRLAKNVL